VPAVTVNVADVEPCSTVKREGTLAAAGLELERDTATPPVPAADVSVTVQVDPTDDVNEVGLHEKPLKRGV
jgi:hypothetical protein